MAEMIPLNSSKCLFLKWNLQLLPKMLVLFGNVEVVYFQEFLHLLRYAC